MNPLLDAALRDPSVYLSFTPDELRRVELITGRSIPELQEMGYLALRAEKCEM